MKKRRIIISIICVFGVFLLLFLLGGKKIKDEKATISDNELIEQFFGIQESEYQIVDVGNTLMSNEYNGSYTVTLNVKEEHMDMFISELADVFFLLSSEEALNEQIFVKNTTGIDLNEVDATVYKSLSSVKRKISHSFVREPKTCSSIVVYTETNSGIYEVRMAYVE